jgi:CheY-specific phosphatase CheX
MNHKTLTQTVEQFDAMVESAARALFETHGLTLGALRADFGVTPEDHDVASSVGFTGPEIRGAILMTTRQDLVELAWPEELRHQAPSERDVCDWAGELVNQLVGRVKNALVPFGLALEQSTPTVVTGWHIHRTPAMTAIARRYLFDAGRGTVVFYFDAAVADDFVLARSSDENLQSAVEGDVRLF